MPRSGMFPTAGFEPGNRPPQPKTGYICAAFKEGTGGCRAVANLSAQQIKTKRIPRCECGVLMVPKKGGQDKRS